MEENKLRHTTDIAICWFFNLGDVDNHAIIHTFLPFVEKLLGVCCDYHLGGWIDGELELAFFAVVHREALHKQGREAGPSASAEGVEDEETLQPSALVRQLPDSVEHQVHQLLAYRVVAASVVVSGVLLPRYELFGMKQLTVRSRAHFVC